MEGEETLGVRERFDRPRGELALRSIIYVFGVGLTLYTIYYAGTLFIDRLRFANGFLGVGVALFYLVQLLNNHVSDGEGLTDVTATEMIGWRSHLESALLQKLDAVLLVVGAVAALALSAYVEFHFDRLQQAIDFFAWTQLDYLVGVALIVLVTDATRRAYGNVIASVVVIAVGYAFAGPYLPGVLFHTGMGWTQVSRDGAIALNGVYGFILEIGTTWVAIFLMFAGMAKAYGLMGFVLTLGREVRSVLKTGVVQVAVIGSMIMGSITGSAAANTATTGSFTIPMIRDQGVREDFAAAIEAVASSGGQMLPPIMGVAAFLMADILAVPYVEIIAAGTLPALLFYFNVGVAVHLTILKFGWTTEADGVFNRRILLQGIHYVIPLGVLLYTLIVLRYSPLSAGMYTIFALIPSALLKRGIDAHLEDEEPAAVLWEFVLTTFDGFRRGAVDMAPLVGILAALGVVIRMVEATGLGQRISFQMVAIAAGIFVVLLFLAMVTSILFGLGMPTPAAYIVVQALIAPALVREGVLDLTAHMFVFYFAMLSAITPPVAVSVAIGAQIAGANFMQSCKQALRIGAPGFVIPFAFVANDSIIRWAYIVGDARDTPGVGVGEMLLQPILFEVFIVLVGTVSVVVSTVGYDGIKDIGFPTRGAYFAFAMLAMFAPMQSVQLGAATSILLVLVLTNTGRLPAGLAPSRQ